MSRRRSTRCRPSATRCRARPAHREFHCLLRSHPSPSPSAPTMPLASVTLLAPGREPRQDRRGSRELSEAPRRSARRRRRCTTQNQIDTIHQAGLFLKATSSLAGAGEGIALRKLERRNDHEVELAVVIGRTAQSVSADPTRSTTSPATASASTSRSEAAKSAASANPRTPTPCSGRGCYGRRGGSPDDLELSLSVNGELRQCRTRTSH